MELIVKPMYGDELRVQLEDICEEETKVYSYGSNQLRALRNKIYELLDDNNLTKEEIEIAQNALHVVHDYLYINEKVPFKMLDVCYLKMLSNNELINVRNSLIKVLNQHIMMYNNTFLAVYSRMIDICAMGLVTIKNELELRNLNPYLNKREISDAMHSISKLGTSKAMSGFN